MQWNELHWKVLKQTSREDFERYAYQGQSKVSGDSYALRQNDHYTSLSIHIFRISLTIPDAAPSLSFLPC